MRLSPRQPFAQDLGPAVEGALAALSREQLAACLRMILAGTPEPDRRELQSSILAFTVRAVPLWRPPLVKDDTLIAEIDAFLKETRRRTGDPSVLSTLMERVDQAFLTREYALARAAHERLLPRVLEWSFRFPVEDFAIPVHHLAARYLVAIYMTTPLAARAPAIWQALAGMPSTCVNQPLRTLKHATLEPMPEWNGFVQLWAAWLEQPPGQRAMRGEPLPGDEPRHVEAIHHARGAVGLERLAGSIGTAAVYSAWAECLITDERWPEVFAVLCRAAEHVATRDDRLQFWSLAARAAARVGDRAGQREALTRSWRIQPSLDPMLAVLATADLDAEKAAAWVRQELGAGIADTPTLAAVMHLLVGDYPRALASFTQEPVIHGWVFRLLSDLVGPAVFAQLRGGRTLGPASEALCDLLVAVADPAREEKAPGHAVPLTGLPPGSSATLGPLLARALEKYPPPSDQRAALRAGFRDVMLAVLEDILEYGQAVAYEHGALVLAAFIELTAVDAPEEDVLARVAKLRRPTAFRKELKRWLGVDPWASATSAHARQGSPVSH
jgi:hypothetical protein